MAGEPLRRVERVVTNYDLTWLLDLHKNEQLNLDPSYQRKSVWTPKDRRFFMDTVFRNYPSPALFLHKTIDDETGRTTYHVVDGKQRISTILLFVQDKFGLSEDFGDERLNGKRWRDLKDPAIRRLLWNYRVTVEELDEASILDINDVFSRLNKNASKLTPQELRHARFDGWLINFLEVEVSTPFWTRAKVRTRAKERRMSDVQNLSELAAVTIRGDIGGFSQDDLDQLYAQYDAPENEETEFDTERFEGEFARVRDLLEALENHSAIISTSAQPFYNLYTLWAALHRNPITMEQVPDFAHRYRDFMASVRASEVEEALPDSSLLDESPADNHVARYKSGTIGATTEAPKRRDRQTALEAALFPRV
ncbi:DUF262 domain-containing protein [Micromonospora sp. NPDC005194]|uniref:DUF262 domain-containing protein n=1 Tax=Micromonospora sp. NPDC005194 TaxID=3156870 RepID=UPI0033B86EEF